MSDQIGVQSQFRWARGEPAAVRIADHQLQGFLAWSRHGHIAVLRPRDEFCTASDMTFNGATTSEIAPDAAPRRRGIWRKPGAVRS
jgi:hypothetical protein